MIDEQNFIPDGAFPNLMANPDPLFGEEGVGAIFAAFVAARKRVSREELATLASVILLDRLFAASAELSVRWWSSLRLACAALMGLLAAALPVVGFVSAMAIDVAVFGGAAESLRAASPLYTFFAVGSLVFAVAVAIAPSYLRKAVIFVTGLACIGASFIAAANPVFRGKFADAFPALKGQETSLARALAATEGHLASLDQSIAAMKEELDPKDGPPLLNDGFRDNDAYAHQLEAKILEARHDKGDLEAQAGALREAKRQSGDTNWSQYLGRLLGALYIFCWLFGAQVLIAAVAAAAVGRVTGLRAEVRRKARLSAFVRRLMDPDPSRREAAARGGIDEILVAGFAPSMALVAERDPDKLEGYTSLFEKDELARMVKMAVRLSCTSLEGPAASAARRVRWFRRAEAAGR